jgi:hypothetical protein
MKTYLIIALVITGMIATASAQTFTAPARGQQVQRKKAPPPFSTRDVTGVIPRAIRGGNPLQMLNPRAPARYGTSVESVIFDPYEGKWKGIKFLTFLF